ncbi:MAG: PspC domain-containing protein [Chitinophagaceae bacterium]|nr:PspC domain-containing protein [Chitinophagaceae bacterium]
MNKVININFQGRILPIEEMAYETLKQYIESLRVYFANEEGRDEIINDIECRIAELCEERLKKGTVCIAVGDIDLIIASIGRPADFEAQDGFEASTSQTQQNTNQNNYQNTSGSNYSNFDSSNIRPKRLYRDEQNKVLGGVCSGIANYFVIEPWIVRILWFFLIGVNILAYLILWIAVPSSSVKEVGGVRKRLFRDIDKKIIGGVAAGLSKYFGIQVWIVRILFLIPFIRFVANFRHMHLFQFWDAPDFPNFLDITFSPGAVFIYIVLWLVLPEAKTSADKLEMVGEKVDLNSIKNTIQNDMEGFSKRAQSWGSDLYNRNKGTNNSNESNQTNNEGTAASNNNEDANKSSENHRSTEKRKGFLYFIGRIITLCIKGFVYFILAIVGISLLATLFGIGVAATALLPLKNFILDDGAQTWSVIGAILLFVWVPIIGIVTAVIRKFAGLKKANVWVRSSFIALWIMGWVVLFYFGSSLGNSFSRHNAPAEQSIALTNPKIDYVEITAAPKMKYYENNWFQFEPFQGFADEDTVYVRNLRIRIVQSLNDSFQVKIVKLSNGKTVQNANDLANKINFELTQEDSLLYLDRGIGINKTDKFRNQHIIMTIAVPIGKRIKITNKGWSQTNVNINGRGMRTGTIDRISSDDNWYDEWNEPWDNESYPFERGIEYKMTKTGLENLSPMDAEDRSDDIKKMDDENLDKEIQLQKLKEEREAIKNDIKKLKEEELQKDKIKVVKVNEFKKDNIGGSNIEKMNKIGKAAGKLSDLQWVLDRFTH